MGFRLSYSDETLVKIAVSPLWLAYRFLRILAFAVVAAALAFFAIIGLATALAPLLVVQQPAAWLATRDAIGINVFAGLWNQIREVLHTVRDILNVTARIIRPLIPWWNWLVRSGLKYTSSGAALFLRAIKHECAGGTEDLDLFLRAVLDAMCPVVDRILDMPYRLQWQGVGPLRGPTPASFVEVVETLVAVWERLANLACVIIIQIAGCVLDIQYMLFVMMNDALAPVYFKLLSSVLSIIRGLVADGVIDRVTAAINQISTVAVLVLQWIVDFVNNAGVFTAICDVISLAADSIVGYVIACANLIAGLVTIVFGGDAGAGFSLLEQAFVSWVKVTLDMIIRILPQMVKILFEVIAKVAIEIFKSLIGGIKGIFGLSLAAAAGAVRADGSIDVARYRNATLGVPGAGALLAPAGEILAAARAVDPTDAWYGWYPNSTFAAGMEYEAFVAGVVRPAVALFRDAGAVAPLSAAAGRVLDDLHAEVASRIAESLADGGEGDDGAPPPPTPPPEAPAGANASATAPRPLRTILSHISAHESEAERHTPIGRAWRAGAAAAFGHVYAYAAAPSEGNHVRVATALGGSAAPLVRGAVDLFRGAQVGFQCLNATHVTSIRTGEVAPVFVREVGVKGLPFYVPGTSVECQNRNFFFTMNRAEFGVVPLLRYAVFNVFNCYIFALNIEAEQHTCFPMIPFAIPDRPFNFDIETFEQYTARNGIPPNLACPNYLDAERMLHPVYLPVASFAHVWNAFSFFRTFVRAFTSGTPVGAAWKSAFSWVPAPSWMGIEYMLQVPPDQTVMGDVACAVLHVRGPAFLLFYGLLAYTLFSAFRTPLLELYDTLFTLVSWPVVRLVTYWRAMYTSEPVKEEEGGHYY